MKRLPSPYQISPRVAAALDSGAPVVALESTVITHGLPRPQNLQLARAMEATVSAQQAVPATIALLDGKIRIGLAGDELEQLANAESPHKISIRDLSAAAAKGWAGGTTVAGTMFAAQKADIKIFATGGIGGAHRGNAFDISADMSALGSIPIVVVCAGAKAILDLPATREMLETMGVPVIGYRTDDFPAFYSTSSGLPVDVNAGTPQEIAAIAKAHWAFGLPAAILVVNPPPPEAALPNEEVEQAIQKALENARAEGVSGAATTPYLLSQMKDLTGGKSLETNLALLQSNARLAAQIAQTLYTDRRVKSI